MNNLFVKMTTHSSLELRNELCIGDPDIFAGDMVKLINAREYRSGNFECDSKLEPLFCDVLAMKVLTT